MPPKENEIGLTPEDVGETPEWDENYEFNTKLSYEVSTSITEDIDNFIFETVRPFCNDIMQTKISKRLLTRALECFREEHNEEYLVLIGNKEEVE